MLTEQNKQDLRQLSADFYQIGLDIFSERIMLEKMEMAVNKLRRLALKRKNTLPRSAE